MSETTRTFSTAQKDALYEIHDGACAICGNALENGWHADHVIPWSMGGETHINNAQALCPTCNLKKSAKMPTEMIENVTKAKITISIDQALADELRLIWAELPQKHFPSISNVFERGGYAELDKLREKHNDGKPFSNSCFAKSSVSGVVK